MEYVKNNLKAIEQYLNNCNDDELFIIHNEYCESCNYSDDEVFNNDEEFLNTFFSNANDAVRAASYGDYNYSHSYVKFNGYANLDSSDYISTFVDVSEIANDILENEQNYSSIELEEEED